MTSEMVKSVRMVARFGSFSKAAQKMGVSQPAVSIHVKNAEKELGIQIFERNTHPLNMTPEGLLLLEYLDQEDALRRTFQENVRGLSSLEKGILRIGGTSAFNLVYLPKVIEKFSKQYPGIDIRIKDGTVTQLRQMILDGEIDLFISSPIEQSIGLQFEELKETRIYLCVPPAMKLKDSLKKFEISFDELDNEEEEPEVSLKAFDKIPLIRLAPERFLGQLLDELIARDKVERKAQVQVDQALTAYMLTMQGVGACLMSGTDIRSLRFQELPHFFMLSNQLCKRRMFLVSRSGSSLSPAAKVFRTLLVNGDAALMSE